MAAPAQTVRPTGERLKDYASALAGIERVRDALNARSTTFIQAQRESLQREADARITTILKRYDFDLVSFNAISKSSNRARRSADKFAK